MGEIIVWLVLLVVLVIAEIATMGLTTIWFAGGALVAVIAAALNAPLYLQIALFLTVSIVMLVFTRPVAMKYFNNERIKTNAESLVGSLAVVEVEIDNLKAQGEVIVNGQHWTARSIRDDLIISKGDIVIVSGISGVKLIVEERKEG